LGEPLGFGREVNMIKFEHNGKIYRVGVEEWLSIPGYIKKDAYILLDELEILKPDELEILKPSVDFSDTDIMAECYEQ
jgi:hypothetical protein